MRAELNAGARVAAVVECQFEQLGQVEIAGQNVGFLAEGAHLHAAARAAAACVAQRLALPDEFLDDQVAVENRGLAEAGADDAGGALDEFIGAVRADLDGRAGLQQAHILDHVQQQIGHLADAVRAVGEQPAGVDLGKVGVGAALFGGDAHLGRSRLVVELDPEALQQFLGLFARKRAIGQPALVEGRQVLVEVAGVEGIPGVQFAGYAQVHEPVVLQRLPEVARGVGGHPTAHFGDAFQFGAAGGHELDRGQAARHFGVAFGKAQDAIRGDAHGL